MARDDIGSSDRVSHGQSEAQDSGGDILAIHGFVTGDKDVDMKEIPVFAKLLEQVSKPLQFTLIAGDPIKVELLQLEPTTGALAGTFGIQTPSLALEPMIDILQNGAKRRHSDTTPNHDSVLIGEDIF